MTRPHLSRKSDNPMTGKRHRHRIAGVLGASLAAVLVVALGGWAPAFADTGSSLVSTGAGTNPSAAYTPPASAQAGVAAKLSEGASLNAQLASGAGSAAHPLRVAAFTGRYQASAKLRKVEPLSTPPGSPTSYTIAGVRLNSEGAGNPCTPNASGCSSLGHPYYTCAAASTRNMTQTMTGVDKGEAQFVSWEGITPGVGLPGISHISSTLNAHYGSYGSWTTHVPSSSNDYLSGIITDTYSYQQSVIQDLDTQYLPYFNGESLSHYDIVYGWNAPNQTVSI